MDVIHVDQELDTPKRVGLNNSSSSAVTVNKGEALVYDLSGDGLGWVSKLNATAANNKIFAGIARKKIVIPANSKGYFEIDEPGSITEALVLDAGVDGVAEYLTLKWKYNATSGGVLFETASAAGRGAALLLEAVTAANPAVATLRKVYLDVGNMQISA